MTSIDEIVRELTGLLEKATRQWPEEWELVRDGAYADIRRGGTPYNITMEMGRHQAALAVAARNHLPALLSALARSRRMEEALRDLERCARETGILYKYEALERSCVRVSQLLNDCAALEDNPNA